MALTLTVKAWGVNCAGRHSRIVEALTWVDAARSHPLGRGGGSICGVLPKVVFRLPAPALLAAGLAAICATPFAFAAPGLQAVYLLPVGFAVWVLRNRTTVDPERLVARSTFGRREVAWSDVKAIKVAERGWLSVVLADDSLVRLPAVRAGHLPMLAAVSGGRVADPNAATEGEADAERGDAGAPAVDLEPVATETDTAETDTADVDDTGTADAPDTARNTGSDEAGGAPRA